MSYQSIRTALKTRLEAITEIGYVYDRYKFTLAATQSETYKSLFVDDDNRVNFVIISRDRGGDEQPDEDNLRIRRHTMKIMYYYSLAENDSTEHTFHDNVDLILADLESGDRTLGGACYTISLPQALLDEAAAIGKRADSVHVANITLLVDEIV